MPRGFHIASAWVDIHAEDTGLRQQVESMIKKAVAGQKIKIPVVINSKGLRKEVTDALKAATEKQKPKIPIGIKSTGLRKEVNEALKRATDNQKPKVKLGISTVGLRAEVQRALTEATKGNKPTVRLGINSAGLRSEVQRALTAATAGQDGNVTINANMDTSRIRRALDDIDPEITPNVNVRHLRQSMMAAIRNINVNDDIVINTNIDGDMLRNQITSEVAKLRDKFRVRIHADLDTDTLAARMMTAARNISGDIDIDLNPRINALKARAEAARAFNNIRSKIVFNGDLDIAMMAAKVKAAVAALNRKPYDLHFRAKVDVDHDRIRRAMGQIGDMLESNGGRWKRWASITAAAALLAPPALAIVNNALKKTGASTAVLVPMVTGLAVAFSTLMVGMQGFGEVVSGIFNYDKLGDKALSDFEVTLDGLAPTARRFVDALSDVKDAFTDVRKSVQGILFDGLDRSLKRFTTTTLPILKLGLAGSAAQFNRMAKDMEEVINKSARTGELTAAFGAVQSTMEPLIPLPGQILNAMTKLTIAASPLLERMNQAFARWSKNMTDKLQTAFDSGQLQASISRAGDTIVNFFKRIATNPQWLAFNKRMQENGPRFSEVFGKLAEALLKLMNALAPVSGALVFLIGVFADLVNAIPTGVLTFFILKVVAFKVVTKAALWVMGLTRALAGLKLALIAINSQAAMVAILQTSSALAVLGARAKTLNILAYAIRGLAKAALVLGVLWAGKEIIDHFSNSASGARPDVDKLQISIKKLVDTGRTTGELKKAFGDLSGLSEGFKTLNKGIKENIGGWETIMGDTFVSDWTRKQVDAFQHGEKSIDGWNKKIGALDDALASLVQGGHGDIAAEFIKKSGISAADSKKHLKDYQKALTESKLAQELAAETMGRYGTQALKVQTKLDLQKKAADGLRGSIEALNDAHRKAMGGEIAMEQAIDDATAALKENGKTLDVTTEKGRNNKRALLDLAQASSDAALAKLEETGSWTQANTVYQQGRTELIKVATQMGMSATAAENFADKVLKIPGSKKVDFNADMGDLNVQISDAQIKVDNLKQKKKTAVGADKAALAKEVTEAQAIVDGLVQKRKVTIDAWIKMLDVEIGKAQDKVDALKQKRKVAVGADKKKLDDKIEDAQDKVDALKQKKKVALQAKDDTAAGIKAAKESMDKKLPKSVKIPILASFSQNSATTAADAIRAQADRFAKAAKGKRYGGVIRRAQGGPIAGYPGGGSVIGPGGPTSDSILAAVSNGEFVMRASSVKKYGATFMNLINMGAFPKFAAGGLAGAAQNAEGSSGAGAVSAGTTTGTFTIKDDTGKPVASALTNFKALRAGLGQTYSEMSTKSTTFGTQFQARSSATYKAVQASADQFGHQQVTTLTATRAQSHNVWAGWRAGMQSRTSSTYKNLQAATSTFQKNATSTTSKTSSATQGVWNSWKSGMVSKTNSTYRALNAATSSFSKQSVTKIGQARDGMGSAWKGLSPKFKPPVSYLVHTVINSGIVGSMNAIMSKLGGGKKVGGISVAGFARGGPIYGEGSKNSDSIPARLSNGEYVIQAKAVDKFGVGFFNQVNRGSMPGQGAGYRPGFATGGLVNLRMAPGFASGGSVPSADTLNKILGDGGASGSKKMTDFIMSNYVMPLIDSGSGGSAMKDVQRAGMNHIRSNIETFVKENFGGAGSASAGLRWAKTQYGKPYQWGGNGNPSWDCSGFMSAIESVIRGEKPHRRWATGAFGSSGPSGWKRDAKAPFQIGITNAGVGHTAGTIGKENVESSGGGAGVHGGVGVRRGANDGMFTSRWGYVGPNATKKAMGGLISGRGSGNSDSIPAWLSNGEYVIRATAARKLGLGYLNALNAGRIRGFAAGGTTSTTATGTHYTIKYGDTLSEIAAKFHTTVSALMALNKTITNANKIAAGQTILIKKAVAGGTTGGGSTGSGGFSLGNFSKVGKTGIQSTEGVNALKGFATLSQEARQAGRTDSETVNAFQGHDSMANLLTDLWDVESKIRGAFKGAAQDKMIAAYEKANTAAIKFQKQLDPINKSLETATASLDDLKEKFDSMKTSVTGAILDFGKITKIGTYGTSGATLIKQLQTDVTKSQNFASQLEQLKALGVNSEFIGQIAEAGITGGGANTAATLLKMTPAELAQLNALQAQLNTAANKAGSAAANGMYGAGVNAAQGLVDGLKSQQKAIEAQMTVIAKAMEKAIKQALGIKSPSKVMARIGNFTAVGFAQGMLDKKQEVKDAVLALGGIPSSLAPATPTGTGNDTMKNGCTTIENLNITVQGTFDISSPAERRKLAEALGKDVKDVIRRDDRKRA